MNNKQWLRLLSVKSLASNKTRNVLVILSSAMLAMVLSTLFNIVYNLIKASAYGTKPSYILEVSSGLTSFSVMVVAILLCGFLLIYDCFHLSIIKDIKSHGLILAIGATTKQLWNILLYQAIVLTSIGIAIGLVLSVFSSLIIVPIYLKTVYALGSEFTYSWSIFTFAISAIITGLCIYISIYLTQNYILEISIVDAIRFHHINSSMNMRKIAVGSQMIPNKFQAQIKSWYIWDRFDMTRDFFQDEDEILLEKHQSQKDYRTKVYTGYGRSTTVPSIRILALGNTWRTLRTNFHVLLSLWLALISFLFINLVIHNFDSEAFAMTKVGDHDFVLTNVSFKSYYGEPSDLDPPWDPLAPREAFSEKLIRDMQTTEYISSLDIMKMGWAFVKPIGIAEVAEEEDTDGSKYMLAILVPVPNLESIDKNMLFGYVSYSKYMPDVIHLKSEKDFILPYSDIPPNSSYDQMVAAAINPVFFIGEGDFDKYVKTPIVYSITADVDPKNYEKVESYLEKISAFQRRIDFLSKNRLIAYMNDVKIAYSVLGYVLTAIIGVVGLLGFINMTIISLSIRKEELSTLQSIGMTAGQVKKMLVSEGILYTILVITPAILIFRSLIAIAVSALILLCLTMIPLVVYKNTHQLGRF